MEDADVRREAARRKILENSEKRLQKITGVENKSNKLEVTGIDCLKPIQTSKEVNSPSILEKHSYFTEVDGISKVHKQCDRTNKEIHNLFDNSKLHENGSVVSLESRFKTNSKHFYILLIPIIWSLLLTVCDILQKDTNYFYVNRIFMPLVVFEIQDYYFSTNQPVTSSLLSSVIILLGKSHSRYANDFIQFLLKILQDVMIYFFMFTVSHLFIHFVFKF